MKGIVGKIGQVLIHILDILLINIIFVMTLMIRFEGKVPSQYLTLYKSYIIGITLILLATFYLFGLYKSLWRYASIREVVKVVAACLTGNILFGLLTYSRQQKFPRSIYILYPIFLIVGTAGIRLSYRFLRRLRTKWEQKQAIKMACRRGDNPKRIMLVGAGEAANIILKDMAIHKQMTEEVILCVDDNRNKQGHYLGPVPIKGTTEDIISLAEAEHIDEIIIAMPSASKKRISEIIQLCNQTSCKLRIFPGIHKLLEGTKKQALIRDVQVEDLLGREEVKFTTNKVAKIIKGQTILVTGGGGSIGSELCRQIIDLAPKFLIVFDIYENNVYDLQTELIQNGVPQEKIIVIIGSVRDEKKLEEVFNLYHPQLIFHAAAHKHVPLMEYNPSEAIKNNVFGTLNVAQCARKFGVRKFVLVSTDKAVNPTNVMGATKRVCEMIVQAMNKIAEQTDFVAVRFGNVLGSNGSVIPLFKRQLAKGGPLTVTHPDIIRYFMTIPEAVRLILEASTLAKGGEIFVLDMGEPVKIYDLAKNFIRLSGLEEGKDIEIIFTGLRPGEKLYEELLMSEEGLNKTEADRIYIGQPIDIDYSDLMADLEILREAVEEGEDIRTALMKVVPTYYIPKYNEQIV